MMAQEPQFLVSIDERGLMQKNANRRAFNRPKTRISSARLRRLRGAFGVLVLASLVTVSAIAESSDESAKRVYGLVMSPFCPGRLLSDCPSDQATELKKEIQREVETGATEEAIVSKLAERYGSTIRAMPTGSGMGLVAWLVPPLFFVIVLGGGLLWLVKRRKVGDV